ncbi:hypothetical protein C900_02578 [Fulvivirga imtechensis AK7]|uniref:Plasmid pRiA4b Orf3-like domain-containing protein n=1 Tax=Fulvivirga imtechensis AK7 TaxID=1237149 RepID=L8JRM4_9BACT|nr:SEC-C metal-binding domain-containing protein [Fulvivirga imtechensis]ELR71515.1 hypothetical protein C900_02578 [Fulvivirga imtechensis AK7]
MINIYQFHIELRDSDPKIWRRIQVTADATFEELHDIIQLAMGWESDHLYEFTVGNTKVYDFQDAIDEGNNPLERDSMDTLLDELVTKEKSRFIYVYDFGDHWEHVIRLEKVLSKEKDQPLPVCIEGEGACPPEDSGGILAYREMISILADRGHPEYDYVMEWLGEDWNSEFFDCNRANSLLQDYAEQCEEIYDEASEIFANLSENEPDNYPDEGFENEYDELSKYSCPEDVLRSEYIREDMEDWLGIALEEPKSVEFRTSERLCGLGFDKKEANNMILQALSVEWFYELKYEIDHMEDRYAYNLDHLPDSPLEITRLQDALAILDGCVKGVPFSAIEYLQNDSSEEATAAILMALANRPKDDTDVPFWYTVAAEGHLCEELIDPVIKLYEGSWGSDWLHDQGQYLIGKLAQKYPELTSKKVLDAMEKDADNRAMPYIFYLFDVFYFCDAAIYKARLLALLERDDLSWYDTLAGTIADLQISEGLPVLKRKLKDLQISHDDEWRQHNLVEVNEAIQVLEGELTLDPEFSKPLCLKREGSWKDHLIQHEHLFYDDGGYFDFLENPDHYLPSSTLWPLFSDSKPYIKEKVPGRNDPCYCGSGKKYKKCCMG